MVGQLAYVTGWINSASNHRINGLAVIDVLDPAAPQTRGFLRNQSKPRKMSMSSATCAYVNIDPKS